MISSDSLFGGRVLVYQEEKGYRFSIDAVLLAGLTRAMPGDRVADLGTGCAVVLLIMAYRRRGERFLGIEIQEELAELAQENVDANGFQDRIEILRMDFRDVAARLEPESFDLVVSNPPYRRLKTGRINPIKQKAVARHELAGSVRDVFGAARYLLPKGGRLAVIYPAARSVHLLCEAGLHGFSPRKMTVIHSNISGPARLVHVECTRGGGEDLHIAPPFFIYGEGRKYSEAMQSLYED